MKLFVATVTPLLLLTSAIANAGVFMEMVTTNAAGQETDRTKIYAQSKKIRMEGGDNASDGTMIFLGDKFLYVDHEDKSYVVMDEEMLDEVSTQMDAAMERNGGSTREHAARATRHGGTDDERADAGNDGGTGRCTSRTQGRVDGQRQVAGSQVFKIRGLRGRNENAGSLRRGVGRRRWFRGAYRSIS